MSAKMSAYEPKIVEITRERGYAVAVRVDGVLLPGDMVEKIDIAYTAETWNRVTITLIADVKLVDK